jgi:hypothetical protein
MVVCERASAGPALVRRMSGAVCARQVYSTGLGHSVARAGKKSLS